MVKANADFLKSGLIDPFNHKGLLYKDYLEDYYKRIGQRLRHARDEAGYTLSDLAKTVDLTPAAIGNYESGIRQISIHTLVQLSIILEKPLHFFLGPKVESSFLINKALKSSLEKYSNVEYIKDTFIINDGIIEWVEEPAPLIPVPPHIAKDHHFALTIHDKKSESDSYYLCKWYKPEHVKSWIPGKRNIQAPKLEPDNLVIAQIGDTDKYELTRFDSITPSAAFKKSKADNYDKYTVNINAVVISRIERLVK